MKTNRLVLFIVPLVLGLIVNSDADAGGAKQLTPEVKANLKALKAIRGTPVESSTFNGRPVLVTFSPAGARLAPQRCGASEISSKKMDRTK
jgi:cytochrome oxidase Cu insertion factor (SCO1/SenC/PrrC family)